MTEQQRSRVLNQVLEHSLTVKEAADILGLSERHVRRLKQAYREQGAAALAHGNRGRRPANALDPRVRERILALATEGELRGVNDSHMAELLQRYGITVSRPTLRRVLRAAGVPSPRTRRPPRHRQRRERMPRAGMLLQVDGSHHAWFGDRGPWATLLAAIDDATGRVCAAHFQATEDARGYFELLRHVVRTHGLPEALYSDQTSIFRPRERADVNDQLQGRHLHPTQAGRLLEELGIRLILARSPQAKGRIERLWGTLQDRLVAELRLAGISTLQAANAFLPGFLAAFNERFAVPPAEPETAFRQPPEGVEAAFCFRYERTVGLDETVRVDNHVFQIVPAAGERSYARARVEVRHHLDGSWIARYQGRDLPLRPAPPKADTLRNEACASTPAGTTPTPRPTAHKPQDNHPWKQPAVRPKRHPA